MPIKTPSFWYNPNKTTLAKFLAPFAILYLALNIIFQKLKFSKRSYKASSKVICVGGLVAGGSGKTPTALAIRKILGQGAFLTRGYGGSIRNPQIVDASKHSYKDVGDEALLLSKSATTVASSDRAKGAMLLKDEKIIIMDDGLLNQSLIKDLSIVVIDGSVGIGNGLTIPAGPLRLPISQSLSHADCVVIIGEKTADLPQFNVPVFNAYLQICAPKKGQFIAFAGLGRPLKFKESLDAQGVGLLDFISFPDHHPYTTNDIKKLQERGLELLTTEKDSLRIPSQLKNKIHTIKAELIFKDPVKFSHFLTTHL